MKELNFENKQVMAPKKMKEVMLGKELTTRQIYDLLQDITAITKNGKTKPWRNKPTKGQITSILGAKCHGFTRLTKKGVYPAIWTWKEEDNCEACLEN